MKPRILIVDDHKRYREALRDLLTSDPNIEIVAEAGDGLEALARASETVPDIVCMDINMPRMDGIEATLRLVALQPGVKVIALSAYADKAFVLKMLGVGALGYVTKGEAGNSLLPAVHAVLKQQTYLCPLAAAAMADNLDADACKAIFSTPQLNSREREVLQHLSKGCTNAEIAAQLELVPFLVELHRRNIMRKLNLHSDHDLEEYAMRTSIKFH